MKKNLITFCFTIASFLVFSQGSIPPFINYQAVIRDANGDVLTTPGTLRFKVYDSLNAASSSYVEDQNFTPNSVGMINLKIGTGTVVTNNFQGITWSAGKVSYEVYLMPSLTPIGPRQQFASVPYAIYALNSGNGGGGIANGTINQTLYWDGTKWKPTSNLSNDGSNVGIGIPPSLGKNKLMVYSSGSPDSSAFVSIKANAGPRDAAVRGVSSGNLSMNSNTNVPRAFSNIYGGDFFGINDGSGNAIGVSGVGASTLGIGTAFGVSGIAVGPVTSTLIGVYASVSTPSTSTNAYAAVFDKGRVSFNDDLLVNKDIYFPNATALPGSVYTIDALKRGYWANPTASVAALTGTGTAGYIPMYSSFNTFSISNLFRTLNNQIGINTTTPNSFFHLVKPLGPDTMLIESPNSSSMSYALKNNIQRFGMTLNGGVFKIHDNTSDRIMISGNNVGIGPGVPNFPLHVKNTTHSVSIQADGGGASWAAIYNNATNANGQPMYGYQKQGILKGAHYINTTNDWVLELNGFQRINVLGTNGNVGIGNTFPNEKLEVSGNAKANNYFYTAPKTRYYNIGEADFDIALSGQGDIYRSFGSGGAAVVNNSGSNALVAPVHIPQGAIVTSVTVWYFDNDPGDMTINFQKRPNGSGGVISISSFTTSGTSAAVQNTNLVSSETIDNNSNIYLLRIFSNDWSVTSGPTLRIVNARITYTITETD